MTRQKRPLATASSQSCVLSCRCMSSYIRYHMRNIKTASNQRARSAVYWPNAARTGSFDDIDTRLYMLNHRHLERFPRRFFGSNELAELSSSLLVEVRLKSPIHGLHRYYHTCGFHNNPSQCLGQAATGIHGSSNPIS